MQYSAKHKYSMKHHSGGFPSERWRSVVGISRREAANQGSRLSLSTIAQPVTPPAASVETPHGFDRLPLHTWLNKSTRQRARSCSCDLSNARAIKKIRPRRRSRRRNQNRKLHKFLERAREYGWKLTGFSVFSLFFLERAHTCDERHGRLFQYVR